jgi:hypothetical protein
MPWRIATDPRANPATTAAAAMRPRNRLDSDMTFTPAPGDLGWEQRARCAASSPIPQEHGVPSRRLDTPEVATRESREPPAHLRVGNRRAGPGHAVDRNWLAQATGWTTGHCPQETRLAEDGFLDVRRSLIA